MAWVERHEPWFDWRSKTLGATHFSPSGALASHEPTSARKQKRFWREHWTETVNVLDIGMSEMMDTESVVDKSPEPSSWAERGAAHNPLSNARGEAASLRADGGMDRSPERSSWTERGVARNLLSDARGEAASLHAHKGMVGSEPRHQVCGLNDAGGVAQNPLSDARMDDEPSLGAKDGMVGVMPKTQGRSPAVESGVAHNPLSGGCGQSSTSRSVGRDTEAPSELEEVMTPECAAGASTTASRRRTTSAKRRRRHKMLAARRMASGMSRALDEMSFDEFGEALQADELAEVVHIRPEEELNSSSIRDEAVLEDAKKALNARSGPVILKNPSDPFYPIIREYQDVITKEPLSGLLPDRGVCHEIDRVPGTKYCVTRQWPLPREQCDVIDAFFRSKHEAGLVREGKSPLSTPTFCIRKPNGKWRIVHALISLMPPPFRLRHRFLGRMFFRTIWWAVRWLSNAPATFNRLVTQLFRPHTAYAQTYFDDIFVHSRAELGKTDVENHVEHLRAVLECMRTNKLYANINKCIFGAEEIPFDLRKWLGLANYLHKYSENYAEMARLLSHVLKKDAEWRWNAEYQDVFEAIKESFLHAPILALPDPDRPFSVVCAASDFSIDCALLQADTEERERVIAFESRKLKAAEKDYPDHHKELLAMKYALGKFRVHLLDSMPFVIYTDHASLRTATQSPRLSQRMARWLSFFAEYNFEVKYKPGKQNALADALSRRPDYELAHVTTVTSSIPDLIRASYASDDMCVALLKALGV
ncbi:unnamed protein product [Phytophthora fragariaefolia]|uniref:Unnamed protein product n=1 Tax=Phytophthora fragariaefolia TaxID=1490495 RepID=A0A9W6Y3R0_9STRA|nr:unnamed protein product [Phytophthora fragariaefolia]